MSTWIHCTGNIGKDPELRSTPNGQEVCQFSLGVYGGKTKEKKTLTQWFNCTVWGKQAQEAAGKLKKGTRVLVSGTMSLSEYQDKIYHNLNVHDFQLHPWDAGGAPQQSHSYEQAEDVPF